MMVWYGDHMGWWGYAAMGVGMVLFWALVIGGIVLLVRLAVTGPTAPPPPLLQPQQLTAEQILAARFARGEITEDEYRDRLAILRS